MIVGLGIDVCSIERMRRAIERHGERFLLRIGAADEWAGQSPATLPTFAAGRFAAKEAFSKALDGARGVGWHEVRIERQPSGRPVLKLSGRGLSMAEEFGANRWHVSISHDADIATAIVILEKA